MVKYMKKLFWITFLIVTVYLFNMVVSAKDKNYSLGLDYICEEVLEPTSIEMENAKNIFKNEGLNVIEDN